MRNTLNRIGLLSKSKLGKGSILLTMLIGLALIFPTLLDMTNLSGMVASTSDVVEPPQGFGLSTKGMVNAALVIAGVLLIFILIYLFDISKYTSKLSGKDENSAFTVNAWLLLFFLIIGMGLTAYEFYIHGGTYADVTSVHGEEERSMFMITFALTTIVFVITQVLLFVYSFIYRYNKNRKALYYAHNNKLEIIWTAVPALVLTLLVLRGFSAFSEFTKKPEAGTQEIEVFAYQFGWTARYAGEDNKLGDISFNYISGTNPLGLAVESEVNALTVKLKEGITESERKLAELNTVALSALKEKFAGLDMDVNPKDYEMVQKEIAKIESGEAADELEGDIKRKTRQLQRLSAIDEDFSNEVNDDIVTSEIHLVKDSAVTLKFRARDVIHSAYMPTHRMQMNCVPGMPTEFTFTPNVSTKEWQAKHKDEEKHFYLYCNKICGQAHFNMKIKVVVDETVAERDAWLATQKRVVPEVVVEETVAEVVEEAVIEEAVAE